MREVVDFLSRWDVAVVPAVALLSAAGAYLWAVRRVEHQQPARPWPRWRTASFLTALALLAFVVMGPIGAFDDELFWAHMVQHVTIMMLVAPLLLIGAPVLLALRASGRETRRRLLVPVLRSRPVRLLTNPVLTWVLFAGALIGTHFTPFYNYAVSHPAVHDFVEHPLYLGVALLYFYPLVGANPVPHGPAPLAKVASLVLMMAPEALTGFFIYTARSVLYPAYAVSPRPFGLGALSDQQLAGGLMWCSAMVIGAVWIAVAVQAWLRAEARKGRRIDRQIAAELAGPVTP